MSPFYVLEQAAYELVNVLWLIAALLVVRACGYRAMMPDDWPGAALHPGVV